jgi:hypothetical protein
MPRLVLARREDSLCLALEEGALDQLHGGKVREWVGKHCLADEDEVDQQLKAGRWEVVGNNFQRFNPKCQETNVAEGWKQNRHVSVGLVSYVW